MIDALGLIATERHRQVTNEGWTLEHDDTHQEGELADAAAAYALHSSDYYVDSDEPDCWPWSNGWNPKDPMTDLVRAGALIVAEIERRLRAGESLPK